MGDFYSETLQRLLDDGWIGLDNTVLVVCGGSYDRSVFYGLGFRRVTISNLDSQIDGSEFAPYPWSLQDVESLGFEDGAFDFAVVHQGLHHCHSPHRGLLEMSRVARVGVLAFEPRDTRLVRLGVKLGFGQEYEIAAVAENGLRSGGVGNSAMPNFIYRWTEREIEKTIRTFNPAGRAEFRYFSAVRVPKERMRSMKNRLVAGSLQALLPLVRLFAKVFPGQSNCFAFAVTKVRELHPWMTDEGKVDAEWVGRRYAVGDGR
ncbi:MAG TPA: methyltransferase domain-containing protein [Edaphobacter sp.]|jgi:SAM-dependent methyltransferase|nr:methyltransferase domain-containing protein [Edaphobacter sp.]